SSQGSRQRKQKDQHDHPHSQRFPRRPARTWRAQLRHRDRDPRWHPTTGLLWPRGKGRPGPVPSAHDPARAGPLLDLARGNSDPHDGRNPSHATHRTDRGALGGRLRVRLARELLCRARSFLCEAPRPLGPPVLRPRTADERGGRQFVGRARDGGSNRGPNAMSYEDFPLFRLNSLQVKYWIAGADFRRLITRLVSKTWRTGVVILNPALYAIGTVNPHGD